MLRLLMLLELERFEIEEFDLVLIWLPNVLEFGAVIRVPIDLLEILPPGVRFVTDLFVIDLFVRPVLSERLVTILLELLLLVIALLEMLGERLVIARLELLMLDERFVMALLEELILGALLVMLLLGARLVIDLLEEFTLGAALGAGAGRETLRLELFDRLELRLERDDLAAKTGSQNNKSAKNKQKTRKKEPFSVLYSDF